MNRNQNTCNMKYDCRIGRYIQFIRNSAIRYNSFRVLWEGVESVKNLLSLYVRGTGKWGSLCKCLQNSLLVLSLFLVSCASPHVPVDEQYANYSQHNDNDSNVRLASKAVNDKLFRQIITFTTLDNDIVRNHYFLHVISSTGRHYLYHDEGSIRVPEYYLEDGNGSYGVNLNMFGEHLYKKEKLLSVTREDCFQSKTKSDVGIKDGCLIQAINFQANLKEEYGDRVVWHSILHVYYTKGGEPCGHAYCVFELSDGNNLTFYAYELSGTRKISRAIKDISIPSLPSSKVGKIYPINTPSYDALTVAKSLKPFVTSALYD